MLDYKTKLTIRDNIRIAIELQPLFRIASCVMRIEYCETVIARLRSFSEVAVAIPLLVIPAPHLGAG